MIGPKTTVTLRRYSESLSGTGASVRVWSDIATLKGTLQTLSGSERFMALKKAVVNTHKFFMDFRKDIVITEKDVLILGSQTFEITSVDTDPVNQNRFTCLDLWEVKE